MVKYLLSSLLLLGPALVLADVPVYGQCGGSGYTGETVCASGSTCVVSNEWYSQCLPGSATPGSTTRTSTSTRATSTSTRVSSASTTRTTSLSSVRSSSSSVRSSTTRTTATSTRISTTTSVAPTPSGPAASGVIGYAKAGGTTGGEGGPTTRVSTLADLTSAVLGNSPKIVILTTSLTGNAIVNIGSNTSVYGASGSVTLTGIGLRVFGENNVIIRNLRINKVLADTGDAIGIQLASRVWVDHIEAWSDMTHGKDYYDGLIDITHGCTYITVSWSHLHDHYKASLVGHSNNNGAEDKKITVSYTHNWWHNTNSRLPSFRFGTGHIWNDYYTDGSDGINTRLAAQLLVENSVFVNVNDAIFSSDGGFACVRGVDLGVGTNEAPQGTCFTPPYTYTLDATSSVASIVQAGAGAKLSF